MITLKNILIVSLIIFYIVFLYGLSIACKEPNIVMVEKSPIPNEYLGEFMTTFYTHTGNRCSTGVYPKVGRTIAVDPKKIPYGTYLYVEGHGVYIAEDTGGDIKGHRLDIFVNSREEAIQLGRKKVKVWRLN